MNYKIKQPEKNKRTLSAYATGQVKLTETTVDTSLSDPTSGDPTSGIPITTTHLLGFRR